jgi:tRNA-specific 2-thiouridylase
MLARLGPEVLGRLDLPLGGLAKDDVRAIASARGLPAADAVESQDVCFVGQGGYGPFLERHSGLSARAGDIVDEHGTVVGAHDGFWHYTVGQRRGIGVASAEPLYVLATRPEANEVVVGPRTALARGRIDLADVVVYQSTPSALDVRIRHHGRPLRGRLLMTGDATGEVVLEDAAEAVAPGQTAALYDGGRLVAAGTIIRAHAGRVTTED